MRGQGIAIAEIARRLNRHRSTIHRELKRNASMHDGFYRATHAVLKISGRQKRSKRNMRYTSTQFKAIEALIRIELSPEQVVGRLILEGKKMIDKRPAVVERRSRFGDWEIDTVHGTTKAGVVTIVERRSGLVLIGKLKRITKERTEKRVISLLSSDKAQVKTITADNGAEFHGYRRIEHALDASVYFAFPHHAWERGTNENTNGLIRQYLPKGMPLDDLAQANCTRVAKTLNYRPRKHPGFKTLNEVYYGIPVVALQT